MTPTDWQRETESASHGTHHSIYSTNANPLFGRCDAPLGMIPGFFEVDIFDLDVLNIFNLNEGYFQNTGFLSSVKFLFQVRLSTAKQRTSCLELSRAVGWGFPSPVLPSFREHLGFEIRSEPSIVDICKGRKNARFFRL